MDRNALRLFAAVLRPARLRDGRRLPRLWFMTDNDRVPDPLAVADQLPAGAGIVLRDYGYKSRANLAMALAHRAREKDLMLLVGSDPALMTVVDAGGLHLPEHGKDRLPALRAAYPDHVITMAAHSREAVMAAAAGGADAVFVSPVFPTQSHPGAPSLGLEALKAIVAESPVPVIALGGINGETVSALKEMPIAGIAAIGALAG